jgi:hypothetical protein
MHENIAALASTDRLSLHELFVDAPRQFTTLMARKAAAAWLLVPFALIGVRVARFEAARDLTRMKPMRAN